MPHIRIRSLSQSQVESLSLNLCKELSVVMETSEDNFTIESQEALQYVSGKQLVATDPFIEVLWFDRGQIIQDKAAQTITESVRKISGFSTITVIFTPLAKTNYYENGKHF
jgi:hypothetical protein